MHGVGPANVFADGKQPDMIDDRGAASFRVRVARAADDVGRVGGAEAVEQMRSRSRWGTSSRSSASSQKA